MKKITIEQCKCDYSACRQYWLVGIGSFVQGSGFSKKEAEYISALINGDREDV